MQDEKPHFYGHRQRLRDRFQKAGLEGLADYEVIELLLTLAIPRYDVKEPAKALISRFHKSKRRRILGFLSEATTLDQVRAAMLR